MLMVNTVHRGKLQEHCGEEQCPDLGKTDGQAEVEETKGQ